MRRELRNTSRWLPRILAVLCAVALTAGVMHLSMQRGRLASYPRVDDIIYMARGAELWQAGHDGWEGERGSPVGAVRAMIRNWRIDPPHSPWASGCAAMGFGLFGVQEWAAYVFTGLPVLAFLLASGRIARRAGGTWGWRAAALVVFAASAPFLAASVQNLKPDYAAGVCSAIGMMILLRGPLLTARWQRLAWAGAWFGLALLAKPAMMIATVLLLAGTITTCIGRDLLVAWPGVQRAWSVRRGLRATAIVFGIAALIALPHYWFAIRHIWSYSTGILEGDAWAFQGTIRERLAFYLTGPGGRLMLDGPRTLVGFAVVLAFCLWAASRGHSRRRAATWAAMLLALGMAWAGPTVARVLIPQFAAAFSALVWLLAVHGLSHMLRPRRGEQTRWPLMAMVGWLALIVLALTWRTTFPEVPWRTDDPATEIRQQRGAFVRAMYEAVRQAAPDKPDAVVLLAGSPTELTAPLVTFWSIRDGMHWSVREVRRIPNTPARSTEPSHARLDVANARFLQSDIILVKEEGMGLSRPKDVTAGSDEFYLGLVRASDEFRCVAKLTDPFQGKAVEVYVRRPQSGTK